MYTSNESESYSIVSLKGSVNLLSRKGRHSLDRLFELSHSLLKSNQNPSTVLIFQDGKAGEYSYDFLQDITSKIYLDELRLSILKIRFICRAIEQSPSTWIYCSANECFGIHAEIAMSCQKFFHFDNQLTFGFPEIRARGFPVAGVFEKKIGKSSKLLEYWEKNPIQTIKSTGGIGPDILLKSSNWQDFIKSKADLRKSATKHKKNLGNRDYLLDSYLSSINGLPELNTEEMVPNYWNAFTSKLKKEQNPIDLARWVVDCGARFFCSNDFIQKIDKAETSTKEYISSYLSGPVFIDTSQKLISTYSVISLLENRTNIIFIGASSQHLKKALEQLYLRLDRTGRPELLDYWKESIRWSITEEKGFMSLISCSFSKDFKIRIGGQEACGLSLAESQSRPWVVEFESLPYKAHVIARACGIKVIFLSRKGFYGDFIRNCALEELQILASRRKGGIIKLLSHLQNGGWHLISSETFWREFIAHRNGRHAITEVGGKTLDGNLLSLLSWEGFVGQCSVEGTEILAAHDLTYHFRMFALLLFLELVTLVGKEKKHEIDVLVSASIGVPQGISLPGLSSYDRGVRKVDSYMGKNWGKRWALVRHMLG